MLAFTAHTQLYSHAKGAKRKAKAKLVAALILHVGSLLCVPTPLLHSQVVAFCQQVATVCLQLDHTM
jgi:hypothetical protein